MDQGEEYKSSVDAIAGRITSTNSLLNFGTAAIYLSNLVLVIRPIQGGGLPRCQKKLCSHESNKGL